MRCCPSTAQTASARCSEAALASTAPACYSPPSRRPFETRAVLAAMPSTPTAFPATRVELCNGRTMAGRLGNWPHGRGDSSRKRNTRKKSIATPRRGRSFACGNMAVRHQLRVERKRQRVAATLAVEAEICSRAQGFSRQCIYDYIERRKKHSQHRRHPAWYRVPKRTRNGRDLQCT